MKNTFTILTLLLVSSIGVFGQTSFWSPLPPNTPLPEGNKMLEPIQSKHFKLNISNIKDALNTCPLEFSNEEGLIVDLPMPDGQLMAFRLFESPIMQAGLAAKYPDIKTYSGYAVDNPLLQGRFDYTYEGFHGYILGTPSPVIIDPIFHQNDELYQVFFRKDLTNQADFICDVATENQGIDLAKPLPLASPETAESNLRTYRLVISTTGEYSQKYGGTKPTVLAEVVKVINRVNSIVGRDFAIRLVLVNNTDLVFYLNASTDPFTNGDTGLMINENPAALAPLFPFADYDMGHLLGTNAGGLAQISSVCSGNKARGVTSAGQENGDQFYVDYVCHEMGHQLGSNHTFNNCSGFAGGNENGGTAFEPGSGSTIMSYSGICNVNNIQFDSDPYYHISSLQEISTNMFTSIGNNCSTQLSIGNHFPVSNIDLEDDFYIPVGTAFLLNGSGSDEDGDTLTYNWEEYDLGPLSQIGFPQGNAPLFRSVPPNSKTYRFFPNLNSIFASLSSPLEVLPTYTRDLTFKLTVRDNHFGGGAAHWNEVAFHSTSAAGPFVVTLPGFDDQEWEVGEYALVKWNVANTNLAPVNCKLVNIRLIQGLDYDNSLIIAQDMPNSGEAQVLVPDMIATNYHIIVEAADNVFLDASATPLSIVEPNSAKLTVGLSKNGMHICAPYSEEVEIHTAATGGYSGTANLSILGEIPTGANIYFESSSITAGESTTLYLDFTQVVEFGLDTINIQVVGSDNDTTNLNIFLEISDFDFSQLATIEPSNGASGVAIFPTLTWSTLANAITYDLQLSASPSFEPNGLIVNKSGMTGFTMIVPTELEIQTMYYWRIRTHNECGASDWTIPSVFGTVNINCSAVSATDVPKIITGNDVANITSTIHINANNTISDMNISHLKGNHSYLGEIILQIISPSGDTAVLLNNQCANSSGDFDLSFDDEATSSNPCILTGKVKPFSPLSIFQGQSTQGDWKLNVLDTSPGSGGKITDWSVEFCSDGESLTPPYITHNDTLTVTGGGNATVPNSLLLVEDSDNSSEELTFTLVVTPAHGTLKLNGVNIPAGGQFTQADVSNGSIVYDNQGSGELSDAFYFAVNDGQGGYIPVTKFSIKVGPVGTTSLETQDLTIYPNPANDIVQIELATIPTSVVQVNLIDGTGRILQTKHTKSSSIQISVRDLAPGLYYLKVANGSKVSIAKLTIQ